MTLEKVHATVTQLGHSDKPIIVGPWLSEVGFELLYWVPFLRWAIETGGIDRDRLWILSRGGCRSWYADISTHYLDLFDLYSPSQIVRLNRARVAEQANEAPRIGLRPGQRTAKQCFLSAIERAMLAKAGTSAGLKSPLILHPSVLYNAFRPIWKGKHKRQIVERWGDMTSMRRLTPPSVHSGLPSRYAAVKFYASEACPNKPEHQASVAAIVRALAESMDVVLLHTGTRYDEHGEFQIPTHPRIHRPTFHDSRNLDEQTAIIAGASVFVGTYGGFAYLAPCLGVPTHACFGVDNFRHDHLTLMRAVAQRLQTPFTVTSLIDGMRVMRADGKRHAA